MDHFDKYGKLPEWKMDSREWPAASLQKAPVWCSVDLRDGNQALEEPMVTEEKVEFFRLLVKLGFQEIEVGSPASSQTDYDFMRQLIDRSLIPSGVAVQIVTKAAESQINRNFDAVTGADQVIFRLSIPVSPLLVRAESAEEKAALVKDAVNGAKLILAKKTESAASVRLELSLKGFNTADPAFALELAEAVCEAWGPDAQNPVIINLSETAEHTSPNRFADQVEWFGTHLKNRAHVILSVYCHNDRGTAVAASELAMLAGADRVEGSLFGNGERCGNTDLLNLAYNLFSEGIDPGLRLEKLPEITESYENLMKLPVDVRKPYAGRYAFTAFTEEAQAAVAAGIAGAETAKGTWRTPYLIVDPADLGREYEPFVRVNGKSGKSSVAFIMSSYFGFQLPKGMNQEFADIVEETAASRAETSPEQIMQIFRKAYLDRKEPLHFRRCRVEDLTDSDDMFDTHILLTYTDRGVEKQFEAVGSGPLDAVIRGMNDDMNIHMRILGYTEHALQEGGNAQAASYIHMMDMDSKKATYGVGISSNITRASLRAIFSAVNRLRD